MSLLHWPSFKRYILPNSRMLWGSLHNKELLKLLAVGDTTYVYFFFVLWGNCPTLKFEKDSIPNIGRIYLCVVFFPKKIPLEFPDEQTKAQQINTGKKSAHNSDSICLPTNVVNKNSNPKPTETPRSTPPPRNEGLVLWDSWASKMVIIS